MKNLIIFDCFGVIIKNDPSTAFMKKYLTGDEINYFRKEIFPKADIGDISMQQIFELFSQKININVEQIKKEYDDLCVLDSKLIEYIKQLKQNNYIVLLSNCPSGFLPQILKQNGLEDLFDKIVISCNCKMIKPNKDIFNYVTNTFNNKFNKSIFIDDNNNNIVGAKTAGIDYAILHSDFLSTKNQIENIIVDKNNS